MKPVRLKRLSPLLPLIFGIFFSIVGFIGAGARTLWFYSWWTPPASLTERIAFAAIFFAIGVGAFYYMQIRGLAANTWICSCCHKIADHMKGTKCKTCGGDMEPIDQWIEDKRA